MLASGRFLLDTRIVMAGELFFGAAKSARPEENMSKVERFAAGVFTVSCDLEVARAYGSRDQHFLDIEGLTVAAW